LVARGPPSSSANTSTSAEKEEMKGLSRCCCMPNHVHVFWLRGSDVAEVLADGRTSVGRSAKAPTFERVRRDSIAPEPPCVNPLPALAFSRGSLRTEY
jgi:hypothetical protein